LLRLGWFSSGRDIQARELLETVVRRTREGTLDARVEFVFCNWEEREEPQHGDFAERQKFFAMVHELRLPLITLSWKRFVSEARGGSKEDRRADYCRKMRTMVYGHPFDLGILAEFPLQVDADTCTRFDLLVLHSGLPSTPPGTAAEMIHRVIASRAKAHGASIRACAPDWEAQATVSFCTFPLTGPEYAPLWHALEERLDASGADLVPKEEIESGALFVRIRSDLERRERALVVLTVDLFGRNRLDLLKGKVYVDGQPLGGPYDLTRSVEDAIGKGEY
jgi:phosphoribosylglycinamide formyltransferase-1